MPGVSLSPDKSSQVQAAYSIFNSIRLTTQAVWLEPLWGIKLSVN